MTLNENPNVAPQHHLIDSLTIHQMIFLKHPQNGSSKGIFIWLLAYGYGIRRKNLKRCSSGSGGRKVFSKCSSGCSCPSHIKNLHFRGWTLYCWKLELLIQDCVQAKSASRSSKQKTTTMGKLMISEVMSFAYSDSCENHIWGKVLAKECMDKLLEQDNGRKSGGKEAELQERVRKEWASLQHQGSFVSFGSHCPACSYLKPSSQTQTKIEVCF